jgi:serine/threonine-protein kinase
LQRALASRMLVSVAEEPREGLMVTGNVRLVRPLGEGGMGSVWVAEHLSLRTNVVVKFMAKDLVNSPEATARFSREAAAASQVKSPHVVQMLDHGFLPDGPPYIVMELLEGDDLEHRIKESGGRLPPREVVAVVLQLARALGKAHERGIVHRDIKPSNVFLLDAGGGELFVKLLDFGIAKGQGIAIRGSTTRSGTFVGSPFYMSPEQVIGSRDVDFRSDLWSLGVVAFEALVGQKPFVAETLGALALKIHRDPMPVPTAVRADLPRAFDAWFSRACAREPAERFASAREMADALAAALLGEGAPASAPVSAGAPTERAVQPQEAAVPKEATHALASTLRTDPGSRAGTLAPSRATAKWVAAIALVAGAAGAAVLLGGFAGHPKKPETNAQAATLAPPTSSTSVSSLPSALTLSPESAPLVTAASIPAAPSLSPAHLVAVANPHRAPAASAHPSAAPSVARPTPSSSASPPSDPDGIK